MLAQIDKIRLPHVSERADSSPVEGADISDSSGVPRWVQQEGVSGWAEQVVLRKVSEALACHKKDWHLEAAINSYRMSETF
jgi:hypothetical protein